MKRGLEDFVRDYLIRLIHDIEVRIISLEAKLNSIENQLKQIDDDMRKILERPEKRRWLP
ncbi:MAG: hypothetical protein J7K49_07055 [Thaumarchaeota archaeon]|nr:hypothetical protein [Nitrososphaerota archaeon]